MALAPCTHMLGLRSILRRCMLPSNHTILLVQHGVGGRVLYQTRHFHISCTNEMPIKAIVGAIQLPPHVLDMLCCHRPATNSRTHTAHGRTFASNRMWLRTKPHAAQRHRPLAPSLTFHNCGMTPGFSNTHLQPYLRQNHTPHSLKKPLLLLNSRQASCARHIAAGSNDKNITAARSSCLHCATHASIHSCTPAPRPTAAIALPNQAALHHPAATPVTCPPVTVHTLHVAQVYPIIPCALQLQQAQAGLAADQHHPRLGSPPLPATANRCKAL